MRKAPPPVSEQIKIIETLLKAFEDAPIQEDDVAYLVSKSWVDQALALRAHAKSSKEESGVTPLGPVDNSDIIQDILTQPDGTLFTRLRPDADLDSFTLFPDDAWKLVMEWYGLKKGQQPIVRTAINTALDNLSEPNILYEFHPPIFRVHRLWSENSPIPIEQTIKAKNPPPLVVARSRKAHAQNFLKDIKTWSGIALNRRVQIYSITEPIPTPPAQETRPALTPPDSPGRTDGQASGNAWPHLLLDLVSFAAVRNTRQHLRMQDHTCDKKYNGKSTLHHQELTTDQTLILDEYIDNKNLVSKYTGKSQPAGKGIPNRGQASALSSRPSSTRSSPAAEGVMTRGRANKKKLGRTVGSVGLHNLGNTCYMNSALQCVRSVEELTKFFITDAYQDEVNKTNLLGYNGRMAMAYGNLLKDIYREDRGSVSPRDFKSTVGRCRSTFSGWGQQDSQEFLGFLLDALQEDLSRVKKKPYIEKPDSTDDMIDDPVAIREMAEKVWDITRQRDDSVIADLFTGMYKSTLKCPECGKISITFDPFNNLTLPLPLESVWNKTVKFFPLNDVPVKIEVELPKHSSIEALKHFISLRTGVPVDRLMGAEEFKDRFFKIYDNTQDISEEIQQSDIPTIHELEAVPTNWPAKAQRKMYRSMLDIDTPAATSDYDDPRYETMVVPVLHKRESAYGGPGVSPPHFISLTKQEASSFDAIQRKVLERVATFSTWSRLANACNGNAANGADNDMVLTNTSDADSSADGKVAARSVEGEDDMVDVTMKDGTEETPSANPFGPPKILRKFKKSRAKFVDPDVFLVPELQNLFQLKYFKSQSDGAIPTGWSSLDNNRSLPNLTDRLPDSSTKDEAASTPESSNATGPSEGEESNNEDGGAKEDAAGQTRMAEEESSEGDESDAEPVTQRSAGPRAQPKHGRGKKKPKQHKAYTKRDNKRSEKQMRSAKHSTVSAQPVSPAVADGGPLVRLYEGIVVEWNDDAWETVFGNTSSTYNAEQGGRTFTDMEVLQDSAIKINQRRRQNRKSRGISLEECLDEFERAEILSEQDMWYCPRCKEHRRASKKFDLWKTPDYLVAHLKRFSSTGWRRDKLDVLVDFPIEGLDLTSRVIHKEDGKSEVYDLIAVDDHYGGLGGGHYTAYAKNFVDGKWYNYNGTCDGGLCACCYKLTYILDSSVSQVSDPSSAVTSAAYLLFYRRRSSGHLGGPRFSQILEKYERDTTEDENEESGNEARRGGRERDSDDDAPPVYDEPTFDSIRRSIEDDDAASSNNGRNGRVKSLDMTQNWSFNGLDSGAEFSTGGDAASDVAQADDSSGEEGGNSSQGYFEGDTAMASGGREHDERVMSILNEVSMYDGSDDVAEIHLEDGKSNE